MWKKAEGETPAIPESGRKRAFLTMRLPGKPTFRTAKLCSLIRVFRVHLRQICFPVN